MSSGAQQPPQGNRTFPDSYITLAEEILAPLYSILAETALRSCDDTRGLPVRVLDIGGGTGQWLSALLEKGVSVGILADTDPEMLRHAKTHLGQFLQSNRLLLLHADAQALPFPDASLDLIVSRNSMHLWPNLPQCWKEIFRVLTPGGTAFIGRGYGPDLPGEIRQTIKNQRKQFKQKANEPEIPEPPSPDASHVQSLCLKSGFSRIGIVPDGKAYWITARKDSTG
ncbi:MAG TPA: class I SAM-dependent methyltransferase [Candidatus Ozemobacteraceae bacterium]|nr:class I SAM-dependent methyltransferase [Candidatus Ozemobacteraceae bacterium]